MGNEVMANSRSYRSWFMDKLLMGLTWPEYSRRLITPFNMVAAIVLSIGLPVIALRFTQGLEAVTHASHDYPWGLILGWGLFGGVPLSATGFIMATAYYIFGYKQYKPLVRLGVLAGFLGYLFAVVYLLLDIGRPWRIYYPMLIGFGTSSVLFLVAWHVATYLTVQLLEFSPAILEWLKARRVRRWATMITIAMTIAGIILSTLHQSALGAMFLLAPGKLHPLWYSPYLPVLFLSSSVYAALAMVVVASTLAVRYLREATDRKFRDSLDRLTRGLGVGIAVGLYVYFSLKVVAIAHGDHWGLLGTPYGKWYLVEILGFVLAPALLLTYGVRTQNTGLIRFGAFYSVLGILVNRINVSMVALNWQLPDHLHHLIPPWREAAMVAAIVMIHILVFRWILNRMPVTREDPEFSGGH